VFITPPWRGGGGETSRIRNRAITIMCDVVLDLRGLRCPLVLIRARHALPRLAAGEELVVLATDPEAPIDLAALAADVGREFGQERDGDEWRLVLGGEKSGGSPTVG
jgi:tRNA 2-thiouridine synthesizing protein A